ncbi:hypothetical protein CHUAL_014013 [Chamberlinius hualienensis]
MVFISAINKLNKLGLNTSSCRTLRLMLNWLLITPLVRTAALAFLYIFCIRQMKSVGMPRFISEFRRSPCLTESKAPFKLIKAQNSFCFHAIYF